jgi:hypothetical protein
MVRAEAKRSVDARKSVGKFLPLAMTLVLTAVFASLAHAQVFSADAVKAAFLHRFASYVEWPPDAFGDGPFIIAVAGANDVAEQLDALLPGITLQGRPAEVRRVARLSELDGAHIFYVGAGMLARTRELRAAAAGRPILLVTDGDEGFDGGGTINFVSDQRRVRFEVSLPAAGRSRLRIDSALLQVAARVEQEPQARSLPWYRLQDGAHEAPCGMPQAAGERRKGS